MGQLEEPQLGTHSAHMSITQTRRKIKDRQLQTPAVGARLILGAKEDKRAQKGSRTRAWGMLVLPQLMGKEAGQYCVCENFL